MKNSVNFIRHQNDFYLAIDADSRLHANHISLYLALFRIWNERRFENPIQVKKEEVLRWCRIGSKSTYVKCLRELHDFNYIIYKPSKAPFIPSAITMLPLARNGTHSDQNCSSTYTEISPHIDGNSAPHSDPSLGRYINKQLNNNNKTGSQTGEAYPKMTVPKIEEVIAFFLAIGQLRTEAIKFFYHNQATGWLLGGNPILDWKAAANKWIENTPSIKPVINAKSANTRTEQSSVSTIKDYGQPL